MSYSELDKSHGLSVWHLEDYLDLIQKHQGRVLSCLPDSSEIDYVPYENVLPNESKFAAEYAALPSGQRVELTGELLKEAKTWGLPSVWLDKVDFERAVLEQRKSLDAIWGRWEHLRQAIAEIERLLRTSVNTLTVESFVRQNTLEVNRNIVDLIHAMPRAEPRVVSPTDSEIQKVRRAWREAREEVRLLTIELKTLRRETATQGKFVVNAYIKGGKKYTKKRKRVSAQTLHRRLHEWKRRVEFLNAERLRLEAECRKSDSPRNDM